MHEPTMRKARFQRSLGIMGILAGLMLSFQNCATLTPAEMSAAQDDRVRPSQIETPDEAVTPPAAAPTRPNDLRGSWAQDCSSVGAMSQRTALTFNEQKLRARISIFGSGNCTGLPGAQIEIGGDYSVKGASGRVQGASSLVLKAASIANVTAMSPAFADAFNKISYCGITTWSASVPQKLPLNAACLNLPSNSLLAGSKQVIEVQDKRLYFGNSDNSKLDTAQAFSRIE